MIFRATIAFVSLAFASQALAISVEEAEQRHAEAGQTNWTVGDSSALNQFSQDNSFGLINAKDYTDEALDYDQAETPADLPNQIDWRNHEGADWMSPMRNQAYCGSCVAFAAVAMVEGQLNIALGRPGHDADLSEQYLFSRIGSCDRGAMLGNAMSALSSRGTPDEACQPYISGRLGDDQPSSGACANRSERSLRVADYNYLSGSSVKRALQNGPVMTAMSVYEDFMFYAGGVYEYSWGSYKGGHAITIVGYNDAGGYWIVKNSWGTDWGEEGYFRIKYNDRSGLGRSGYNAVLNTPDRVARIATPAAFTATTNRLFLEADFEAPIAGQDVMSYAVRDSDGNVAAEGVFDPGRDQFVDLDGADGVYELSIGSDQASGFGDRAYRRVVLVSEALVGQVGLDPQFDASEPVSERVYFDLTFDNADVPLTSTELRITNAAGEVIRSVTLVNPGPRARAGWRTVADANGSYQVKAVGRRGDIQVFESDPIDVVVQN